MNDCTTHHICECKAERMKELEEALREFYKE